MGYKALFLLNEKPDFNYKYMNGYNELFKPIINSGYIDKWDIYVYEREINELIQSYFLQFKNISLNIYPTGKYVDKYFNCLKELKITNFVDEQRKFFKSRKTINFDELPKNSNILITSENYDFFAKKCKNFNILNSESLILDKVLQKYYKKVENEILKKVDRLKPDIIFYAPPQIEYQLPKQLFLKLKQKGIKIVIILWDFDENNMLHKKFEIEALEYADLLIENTSFSRIANLYKDKDYINLEKLVFHPTIFDEKVYKKRRVKKIYDIAIFGRLEGVRAKYAKILKKEFKNHFFHFYNLSQKEYVKKLNQTKIFVNTQTFGYRIQYKGKIREALMCGSFILEEDNIETKHIWKNNELIYFKDKYDLINKIKYYLKNKHKMEKIANIGYKKFKKNNNSKKWTKYILNKIYSKGNR